MARNLIQTPLMFCFFIKHKIATSGCLFQLISGNLGSTPIGSSVVRVESRYITEWFIIIIPGCRPVNGMGSLGLWLFNPIPNIGQASRGLSNSCRKLNGFISNLIPCGPGPEFSLILNIT